MTSVAIVTVSDKGARGEREDLSGPAAKEIAIRAGWKVEAWSIVPDEKEYIQEKLIEYADHLKVDLVLTSGGTGFAPRDVTPEATLAVVERLTPGIPEAMRLESLKKTPRAMLSRAVAGIRGKTLIINLPGSPRGVQECLEAIVEPLQHGIRILQGQANECGGLQAEAAGRVESVNISAVRGVVKERVEEANVLEGWGVEGDAHGGDWDRQVSIFPLEALDLLPEERRAQVEQAGYMENFTISGIALQRLQAGTVIKLGEAVIRIMQVGKEHKEHGRSYIVSREGRFGRVLCGGKVKAGDAVTVQE